jgi:hypothetical protein
MLTRNDRLSIFDNFRINDQLSKFNSKDDKKSRILPNTNESWGLSINNGSVGIDMMSDYDEKKNTVIDKVKRLFKRKNKTSVKTTHKKLLTFFSEIVKNINTLVDLSDSISHYENLIKQAVQLNQTALKENLEKKLIVIKNEIILYTNGITKFITERQLVDFYKKTDENKNLKLTWIKNYIRLIQSEVLDIKNNIDKLEVFDNYVILHYDPDNIATDLTEKEKEIAKDPILFGVFENSNKLYFIADWKDDYCDLTLDDIIKTLGEKVYKINNNTLKSYIDNKELKKNLVNSSKSKK